MSTILAIETSVPDASLALWRGGEFLGIEEFTSDRNHNSMVFDALERVLDRLAGDALDLVLVGTGPGSYSGTRIGIAAGQGIALAHGCPAVGVGSFAATSVARSSRRSIAVGDARRGVYFISRMMENGLPQAVELMDHDGFVDVLRTENEVALFTHDDPAVLNLDEELTGRVERVVPRAEFLVDVWQGLDDAAKQGLMDVPLSPTYLRAPFTSKAKPGHPLLRSPLKTSFPPSP